MLDRETEHFVITVTSDKLVDIGIKFTDGLAPLCTVEKAEANIEVIFPDQALQDYIVDWETYTELAEVLDDIYYQLQATEED